MAIDKDSFYELLCKTLDPRSGKILPIDKTNESGWRKVLDIEWKGGIHFMVFSSKLLLSAKQQISSVTLS